jgi:hypothetical protein
MIRSIFAVLPISACIRGKLCRLDIVTAAAEQHRANGWMPKTRPGITGNAPNIVCPKGSRDLILAYAPASEGQSLQGREPKFNSNRTLNGSHATRVMPLIVLLRVALGTSQGRQVEEREVP